MNDNIMKSLIDQLTMMIKEGYDFGKGQIPEIGQQLIRYYEVQKILAIMGLLFMATLSGFLSYKTWVIVIEENESMDGRWVLLTGLGVASAIFLIISGGYFGELLKIWIAPKVFLLDCLHEYL